MHIVLRVLQRARQILNLLFLLLEVDIHLLDLSAQSSVFIPRDVILNFEVSVQIFDLLLLNLSEDWCLVGFHDIALLLSCEVSIFNPAPV